MPSRSVLLSALVAGFVLGCKPDPIVTIVVDPYEGAAYPDRIASIVFPSGPSALVTDSYSDTISLVDLTNGERVDHRVVGRNPIDLDGPHHMAVDEDGGFVYVALSYPKVTAVGPHAAHGSSSAPGYIQKLNLADLSVVGQVRVDASPGDIGLTPDKKRVITTHFDLLKATKNPTDLDKARSTIAIADPTKIFAAGSESPKLVTVCVAPHGMAMTGPTGSPLYVACYGEDKIAVVDLDGDAPIEYVDVGPGVSGFGSPTYGPYALKMLSSEPTLVISDTASHDVRFMDLRTNTIDGARTLVTLGAPYFPTVSADGTKLVIPTQQPDALLVVDLAGEEDTVTRTFTDEECVLPHVVETVADGYAVVCEGDKKTPGTVLVLDAALTVLNSTEVGVYPDSIVRLKGGGG